MRAAPCFSIAFLAAFGMASAAPGAGRVSPFGREKTVQLTDFRPHLSDTESYGEQWRQGVWSKDGRFVIGVDFAITNQGVGDHKAAFRAEYIDSIGHKTECNAELDSDDWSWTRSGFGLDFKKGKLSGDMQGIEIEVRCKKLSMDLRFENRAPPVRPGSGELAFSDEGAYDMVFTSPRARVTGELRVGGKTIVVNGIGHADHAWSDIAPHKANRRWFRFEHIDERASLLLAETEVPAEYGSSRHGWALLYTDRGRLMATARVRFDFDGFIEDKRSEEGYRIPRRVRVIAQDGQRSLSGQLVMTQLLEVRDPTADWGSVVRFFARRFAKPKDYHIGCAFSLLLLDGSERMPFEGKGEYRFSFTNP
ncbi:MAG: hypothetical protein JXR96_00595 [Deltaproteobacteria bacterium]|nr:hypothetical protein [Deltaproteobacteria bacterium]